MSIPSLSLGKPESPPAEAGNAAPSKPLTFLSLCHQRPSGTNQPSALTLSTKQFHQIATSSATASPQPIGFLALSTQSASATSAPSSLMQSTWVQNNTPSFQKIPLLHPDGTFNGFFCMQGEVPFIPGKSNHAIVFRSYSMHHFNLNQSTGGKHLPPLFHKHLKENRAAQLLAIPVLPILNRETASQDGYYVLPRVENLSLERHSEEEWMKTLQKIVQSAYDFELPIDAHASQFHFDPTQNQIVLCELPFTMKNSQEEAFSYVIDSILTSWCNRFFPKQPEKKQLLDPRILTLSSLPKEEEILSCLVPQRISQLLLRAEQALQQSAQAISPSSIAPSNEEQKAFALSMQALQQEMGLSAFSLSTLRNLRNIQETLQQIFNTGNSFREHLRSIQIRTPDAGVHNLLSLVEKKGLLQEKPSLEFIRTSIIPFVIDLLCQERPALRSFFSPAQNNSASK